MFFKKQETQIESNFLIKVCALLIHAARIDENYTDNEEQIINKTLLELGATKEGLAQIIKEAKIIEFFKSTKKHKIFIFKFFII